MKIYLKDTPTIDVHNTIIAEKAKEVNSMQIILHFIPF